MSASAEWLVRDQQLAFGPLQLVALLSSHPLFFAEECSDGAAAFGEAKVPISYETRENCENDLNFVSKFLAFSPNSELIATFLNYFRRNLRCGRLGHGFVLSRAQISKVRDFLF